MSGARNFDDVATSIAADEIRNETAMDAFIFEHEDACESYSA